MKKRDLIKLASSAYPGKYYNPLHSYDYGFDGDFLADLISEVLSKTYISKTEKSKQLNNASHAIKRMIDILESVHHVLFKHSIHALIKELKK